MYLLALRDARLRSAGASGAAAAADGGAAAVGNSLLCTSSIELSAHVRNTPLLPAVVMYSSPFDGEASLAPAGRAASIATPSTLSYTGKVRRCFPYPFPGSSD